MAAPSENLFQARLRTSNKLGTITNSEGKEIEVENREDEEQNVKLNETIELLLAAGYFRARIKGLAPFDKVVGGMTWCVTTCNVDIDIDLLFQENSTIGQKIALTEKIVEVLPKMKCPHRLEPHQIQGLDFIHIFPVVQWLVKRAIETREELGDYIRAYAVSQFNRHLTLPQEKIFEETKIASLKSLSAIKERYKPKRIYRRCNTTVLPDQQSQVQSTLLEFGKRPLLSSSSTMKQQEQERTQNEKMKSSMRKKAIAAGLSPADVDGELMSTSDADRATAAEEERIQGLMKEMSSHDQLKVSASAVGSIVGLQSEQIRQAASEYARKQAQLNERPHRLSGAQLHNRAVQSMQKQTVGQQMKLDDLNNQCETIKTQYDETLTRLKQAQLYRDQINNEMEEFREIETGENNGILEKLNDLVSLNESLRKQEQEFKKHCQEEMLRFETMIDRLKSENEIGGNESSETTDRIAMIEKQYSADKEKLQKARLLVAKKNREISGLERKIDEVPSRAELSQYQRRFIELYNQVASKHKETKQYYTLYNTLDDTKLYLEKEVNLLNSIHDNFTRAMASTTNKEEFLKQFQQIVEGVILNKSKVETRRQDEKLKRDKLNDSLLDLLDKQRLYFKAIKEFTQECKTNEILLSKLKQLGVS